MTWCLATRRSPRFPIKLSSFRKIENRRNKFTYNILDLTSSFSVKLTNSCYLSLSSFDSLFYGLAATDFHLIGGGVLLHFDLNAGPYPDYNEIKGPVSDF